MFETLVGIKTDEILPLAKAWIANKSWNATAYNSVASGTGALMTQGDIITWIENNLLQFYENCDHTEPIQGDLQFYDSCDHTEPIQGDLQFYDSCDHTEPTQGALIFYEDCES